MKAAIYLGSRDWMESLIGKYDEVRIIVDSIEIWETWAQDLYEMGWADADVSIGKVPDKHLEKDGWTIIKEDDDARMQD